MPNGTEDRENARREGNELWQRIMGWFVGFLIIGLFIPAIMSINLLIGIGIWILTTLTDMIFLNWAISNFIIRLLSS